MLSRSCFNLLNLDDYSSDRTRIPRVISVPGIIPDFEDAISNGEGLESNDAVSSISPERRIIVANKLPLKGYKDSSSSQTQKWCFDWDEDALVLQLKDGFSPDVEVLYVGCLGVDVDPMDQEEVAQLLLDKFDKSTWQAYVSANKIFADKVMEVINPDEDYEEILRALLNCDLIGFHTFDYARHFLSCCSRMLGLDYQSKRGYIGLDYYGRTVSIKILPVGIHMGQIESIMSLPNTADKIKELKKNYDGKIVLLGVDDVDMFKGIGLKFMAFALLLDENPKYRGNVVLVQIMNAPRSQGKDIQEVQDEINKVANEINRKYGKQDYQPIVCVNGPVSFQDKVAYYAISECVVVNAVRDGMNLVPYKYTVSRQGCPDLDKALGVENCKKSVIIVSEFIGCSPSLSGAIRVNPWDINSVSDAMVLGITMKDSEKELRHEKHYKYVASHDVAYWAKSFDQDFERACSQHYRKRCWGIGFGLNSRVVALGPNFRKLSVEHIVSAYKNTNSRLILLDYDGTMTPQDKVDKSPSVEVILVLNSLCNDPKNIVFIVSGRGKDSPDSGLRNVNGSGCLQNMVTSPVDLDWKKNCIACNGALHGGHRWFVDRAEGECFSLASSRSRPDFGLWQAKELLDHLESVLANDPVVVKSGQQIVEVKPQGVSKGVVVKNLTETMRNRGKPADFVLCIGDDRSDEDMFEAIATSVAQHSLPDTTEVFACTVGQKPSMAKYYLDDTFQVIKMLQGLSAASGQPQTSSKSGLV
ncbi:hypothetical protein DH2020_014139 [Rehmannia glutinosa]|uniref:Trehalose-6-phosphate synthase n=1 Tax=Rehmannia glutinosa TaxID=99300 RepID=A0ABR0WZ22_REHGL